MLSARPIPVLQDSHDYLRLNASKTPGRTLKGRAGLQENVLYNGSKTVNPKEKRVALQTPFRQGNSKIILHDAHSMSKPADPCMTRPLGDKTPKPNRQSLSLFTPGPRGGKPAKLTLPVLQDESEAQSPSQPPSSTRKKLRTPRISSNFQTPITKGDHWNVSDVSIEEGSSILAESNGTDVSEPDDSELEYMPPKSIEPAYEPPFEMPDYKEAGLMLRTLAYSYPPDDTPFVYEFDTEDLLKGCEWSKEHMQLDLPEFDEDEIFGAQKLEPKANAPTTSHRAGGTSAASRQAVSRTTAASRALPAIRGEAADARIHPSRPATSLAVRPHDRRPAPPLSRPGTSASNSRPPSTRSSSRTQLRCVPSMTSRMAKNKRPDDDMLAVQFSDELETEDDFRFKL